MWSGTCPIPEAPEKPSTYRVGRSAPTQTAPATHSTGIGNKLGSGTVTATVTEDVGTRSGSDPKGQSLHVDLPWMYGR